MVYPEFASKFPCWASRCSPSKFLRLAGNLNAPWRAEILGLPEALQEADAAHGLDDVRHHSPEKSGNTLRIHIYKVD